MTKEKLIETVKAYSGDLSDEIVHDLYEFFSQNVVIPRGASRHPSSDVLHQAIEGIKIQGWNHIRNEWEDDTSWFIDKNDLDYPTKYRIKPSEPVYEYQWYCFVNGEVNIYHAFMTIDEYNDGNKALKFSLNRFEETKRERR